MAIATYAMTLDDIVIDIIEFDIFSGEKIPVENAALIRVGEPTPTPIPTIGQKWNGELNIFE